MQRAGELAAKISAVPPLLVAAARAEAGVVALLLERHADPCAADRDGVSALMLACHHGLESAATALLQARRTSQYSPQRSLEVSSAGGGQGRGRV